MGDGKESKRSMGTSGGGDSSVSVAGDTAPAIPLKVHLNIELTYTWNCPCCKKFNRKISSVLLPSLRCYYCDRQVYAQREEGR